MLLAFWLLHSKLPNSALDWIFSACLSFSEWYLPFWPSIECADLSLSSRVDLPYQQMPRLSLRWWSLSLKFLCSFTFFQLFWTYWSTSRYIWDKLKPGSVHLATKSELILIATSSAGTGLQPYSRQSASEILLPKVYLLLFRQYRKIFDILHANTLLYGLWVFCECDRIPLKASNWKGWKVRERKPYFESLSELVDTFTGYQAQGS